MRPIRILLAAALAASVAPAALPLHAQDYAVAHTRGAPLSRSAERIDEAVREFGFRPQRLTAGQVRAINDTWRDLFGPAARGAVLSRRQATAIVYLALVHDDERRRPRDRDDHDYSPPRDDRAWTAACDRMEGDAYRLGVLVTAPERNTGLFVQEPELGRARALARQIQEQAIGCRALGVADRAGEVLTALSAGLPGRSEVGRRVEALKREIDAARPVRSRGR